MLVTNNSSVPLYILGKILMPKDSREYTEMMFNTLDIHSKIGSCVITTEYGTRGFQNFGNLKAQEGNKKNDYGMNNILVYSD